MIGNYVRHPNGYFALVVGISKTKRLKLLFEDNTVTNISAAKVSTTALRPAKQKYYDGEHYLVTGTGRIISLKTGKFCEPKYKEQILKLSGIEQAKEVLRNSQMSLAI